MNKEKLIEEMAKIIATAKNCEALALSECINRDCKIKKEYGCRSYFQAEDLYNAGYRKAEEVRAEAVKEFLAPHATQESETEPSRGNTRGETKTKQKPVLTALDNDDDIPF